MNSLIISYNNENNNNLEIANITEKEENTDICGICQESLDSQQVYKLPECSHNFHTNCIITWFRTGYATCPYCKNINIGRQQRYSYGNEWKLQFIRQYARRNNAPKLLKQKVDKLKESEKKRIEYSKEIRELGISNGNYKDIERQIGTIKFKKSNVYRKIYQLKAEICNMGIIPLIIPIELD